MAGPKIRQSENSAPGKTNKLRQNPDFYLVIFLRKSKKKPFRM
jgi:hypothetical protein